MNGDTTRRDQQLPDVIEDGVILALWHERLDTYAIAKHLGRPEFQIANRLLHIRDADFRKLIDG